MDNGVDVVFFFKQKTAYEIGTGDWSSDVCSSDLSIRGHKRSFSHNLVEKIGGAGFFPYEYMNKEAVEIGRASCRERV